MFPIENTPPILDIFSHSIHHRVIMTVKTYNVLLIIVHITGSLLHY